MARHIRVSADGSILEDIFGDGLIPISTRNEWVEAPFDDQYMLGRELYQLRWDGEHIRVKTPVELAVGGAVIPADGMTEVAIGVRGDIPPTQKVIIKINGEPHEVTTADDIMLTSDSIGQYTIRVEDPLVYASPSEKTVVAVSPDEQNDATPPEAPQ